MRFDVIDRAREQFQIPVTNVVARPVASGWYDHRRRLLGQPAIAGATEPGRADGGGVRTPSIVAVAVVEDSGARAEIRSEGVHRTPHRTYRDSVAGRSSTECREERRCRRS